MYQFSGDFDEIKQDISSFRYEMLNHINVKRDDNAVDKDKMDRLTGKLDAVLITQKELARGLSISDESNATRQYFLSTGSDSMRSSTETESLNTYKGDDDDMMFIDGTPRLTKLSSVKRKFRSQQSETKPDSPLDSQPDIKQLLPKAIPLKRDEMLKRQEVIGSSIDEDITEEAVGMSDIEVRVVDRSA